MTNSQLDHYANIILGKPTRVDKTHETMTKLDNIAKSIYERERTRKGRSKEKVWDHVQMTAAEYALADLLGVKRRNVEFDVTDRLTYGYDVDGPDNTHFECKPWAEKWYSFSEDKVCTMRNNLDIIDYVCVSERKDFDDHYLVNFKLIFNAKTFNSFVRKTKFVPPAPGRELYYDHWDALRVKQAKYTKFSIHA